MDSKDLRIFHTVAQEKSITRAAEVLGYVQSNVTARIRQLEKEVGIPLFYRSKKGMILTKAGHNLLEYSGKIIHLLDEALKSVQYTAAPSGPLVIGALETTAAVHMPKLLKAFLHQYPEVKLSLCIGHTNDLMEKVLDYRLDGAFVNGKVDHPDLEQVLVFKEELVLVSENSTAELSDLMSKPMLFLGRGCSMRDRLEQWMEEEGIEDTNIMEFGTLEAILGGASAGLGVSLLPKSAVKMMEDQGLVCTHPIPDHYRHSHIYFVYRKDLFQTCAFEKFLEHIG
ncbi:LysR family transcriptional regulator [Shimazuella sp. AN120528]|uniref:LysR family transcriptional regulator n=1 Tax=Shimazuella soli TaxID=1892854 RepID=UPI001F0CEEA6|nr:LysR family transcriptional regulator [Shimazuella soli]MCH5584099.1 LysR family transcriptional regulator [Shimazuella soli]